MCPSSRHVSLGTPHALFLHALVGAAVLCLFVVLCVEQKQYIDCALTFLIMVYTPTFTRYHGYNASLSFCLNVHSCSIADVRSPRSSMSVQICCFVTTDPSGHEVMHAFQFESVERATDVENIMVRVFGVLVCACVRVW